jgi:hypothetical protein
VRRPAIIIVVELRGPPTALVLADSLEDQERIREAIIRRGDLVPAVAVAVGDLLDALDAEAEEGDPA